MEILGIGTDIIEISRIKESMEKGTFLEKVFCESEIKYIKSKANPYQTASGYFCAKEAVVKALGTGFCGISHKDICVSNDEKGKPCVTVSKYPDVKFMLTVSHCKEYAAATAIAIREGVTK